MSTNILTDLNDSQIEAVAQADAYLNNAVLPTYTDIAGRLHTLNAVLKEQAEIYERTADHARGLNKLRENQNKILLSLLSKVQLYIDGGQYNAARDIVSGLIENRK